MRETTESDYLSRQLIAYIGNKRRLLPFLSDAFRHLEGEHPISSFVDPFSGSGSVSRLAKSLGYAVAANDWEHYAWVVTAAHLVVNPSDGATLFESRGGVEGAIGELNRIGEEARRREDPAGYLAATYAPKKTDAADYRTERLFYSAENARFLDAVRDRVEQWYPGWELGAKALKEKLLLVSAIIYEAATHANTSGVFKAFHKGFGGFGRDSLKRILAPAVLELPVLWESERPMTAAREPAVRFAAGNAADLCYLDPPYTTHQYGSNYHLLNTIVLWDKPPVGTDLKSDGRLAHKAGIRRDWVRTRSDFCVRSRAAGALEELIESIDARVIALSYNTEGIVSIEEVYEIMSRLGRTTLMGTDYVLYRGGKQSMFRNTYNLEYLLILRPGHPPRPSDREEMRRFLVANRLSSLLKSPYSPARVEAEFLSRDDRTLVLMNGAGPGLELPMRHRHLFVLPKEGVEFEGIPTTALEELVPRLEAARCRDRREEAEVLTAILESKCEELDAKELRFLQDRLAGVLKKFGHRKYRAAFEESCNDVRRLVATNPERLQLLSRRLEEIERVVQLRFSND